MGGPLIRVEDPDGWKMTEFESGECGLDASWVETSEFDCCSGARSTESLENRESVDRADSEESVVSAGSAGCRMKRRMLSRFGGQFGCEETSTCAVGFCRHDTHNDPLQITLRCGLAVDDVDKSTLPADHYFGFGLHRCFEVGQDHRGLQYVMTMRCRGIWVVSLRLARWFRSSFSLSFGGRRDVYLR
jgi:hypothetical protein